MRSTGCFLLHDKGWPLPKLLKVSAYNVQFYLCTIFISDFQGMKTFRLPDNFTQSVIFLDKVIWEIYQKPNQPRNWSDPAPLMQLSDLS